MKNHYESTDFEYLKFVYEKENLHPVFATELDVFPNIANPNVCGKVMLWELLQKIRYNIVQDIDFNYLLIDKYVNNKLNSKYEKLKGKLPAICYNATYSGYKDLNHLKSSTNLMFLDIDDFNSTEEAINYRKDIVLRYDWILACNLSLSRKGLHVIILVDRIIDNDDFNDKYDFISNAYFDGRLDKSSKSLTRYTVVPHDLNIYINENPQVLNIELIINSIQKGARSVYKREEIISTACTFFTPSPLREIMNDAARNDGLIFNQNPDASYFSNPNVPLYERDGIDVVEVNLFPYLNSKVEAGSRNKTLGAISLQMIYLNADSTDESNSKKEAVLKFMHFVNKSICQPPLTVKEVVNIVNANWKRYEEGRINIKPFTVKKRAFWSPECKLKGNEKRKITCGIKNAPLVAVTNGKILDAIEELHNSEKKITQKQVVELSGLSVRTVKKYWGDYKEMVKYYNNLSNCKSKNNNKIIMEEMNSQGSIANESIDEQSQSILSIQNPDEDVWDTGIDLKLENPEVIEFDEDKLIEKNNEEITDEQLSNIFHRIFGAILPKYNEKQQSELYNLFIDKAISLKKQDLLLLSKDIDEVDDSKFWHYGALESSFMGLCNEVMEFYY